MANPVFKNAALSGVGTTQQQVYVAPSLKTSIIIQLDVANVKNVEVLVDVYMVKGGNPYYLAKGSQIAVGGTLQAIYGQKQVLQTGDSVWVKANTTTAVDVICSVTEDV